MMTLETLINSLPEKPLSIVGATDRPVKSVEIDSRAVAAGALFVAMRGSNVDGHAFIERAVSQGAAAVVCEEIPATVSPDATYIVVSSTQEAVGALATTIAGNPSQRLKLVGVTGTNGKTTIATSLYHLFGKLGYRCGLLSTVCNYIGDEPVAATHTTPDAIELNRLLARMVEAGCEYVFMECSSHAIDQRRIGSLTFAGGIFTNLTRDHLDYHKTFAAYRDAKKRFFDDLPREAFAIVNADDSNGQVMVQNCHARVRTYSTRSMADYRARLVECHYEGMYLEINGREVGVQFIGRFNVSNLLAIYAAAIELGQSADDVLVAMSTLKSVAGRLEPIRSADGVTAVVDYAHTPDALQNVLSTLRDVMQGRGGQLITVCGAGGNRDKGKRPLMAQEAVRQSDRVIITSDNPRFEDPQAIIDDMMAGLDARQQRRVLTIADRRQAIRAAVMMAQKGDVILIAGKGHEDYQEVQGVKHHFDDREEVRACFA